MLDRNIKFTYKIISGQHNLDRGHYLTWELWNILCFTFTGYNYKKYPGKFNVDKTLRKLPQAIELSDRCYSSTLDQFDIAMRSWWSNLKSNPNAKYPKPSKQPRNLKFQVGRNAKQIGIFEYRLSVLGGKVKDRYATIKVYLKPGIKMSMIKWLEIMPDGTGCANIEIEKKQVNGDGLAAIDLGIINIATMAFNNGESILVSGKGLLKMNQWYNKQAAKCKPKNWKPGQKSERPSQRYNSYRTKAGNIQKLAVHNLTTFIVRECVKRDISRLVVGDLSGIRDAADYGKQTNQKLHNWPFYQIREQLKYKCLEYGIELIAVSEAYTSQRCHICGQKGVRNPRGLLKCKTCNIIINSDVNGAFGILNKVSPAPVCAGVGVEADFPGLPSPEYDSLKTIHRPYIQRTGKAQLSYSQIEPTFVAKFDLRNWSIGQIVATRQGAMSGANSKKLELQ